MEIYEVIDSFRRFAETSWVTVMNINGHIGWDDNPYFEDDWLQANWELLVEKALLDEGQFLAPYGYNTPPACRYIMKERETTHHLCCRKKNAPDIGYFFCRFGSMEAGRFTLRPPYNFVSARKFGQEDIVELAYSDLDFFIKTDF
ncbi:hypothetical protein [Thalassospira xiamenensis]|uniref:hypothetical protein n=1 Tax=Thalassospira xiamenensis TaxID=220697 RepID=UPI003AA8D791